MSDFFDNITFPKTAAREVNVTGEAVTPIEVTHSFKIKHEEADNIIAQRMVMVAKEMELL